MVDKLPFIAIFVPFLWFYFRRTRMLKNRWVVGVSGLIGLWGILYVFWDTIPNIILLIIGILLSGGIVLYQWRYYEPDITKPHVIKPFNREKVKSSLKTVYRYASAILLGLEIAGMIFLVIYDYAIPIVPAIAWKAIATLWFAQTLVLYIDRMQRIEKQDAKVKATKEANQS